MEKVVIACSDRFALDVLMIIELNNDRKLSYAQQYEVAGYITSTDDPLLEKYTDIVWLGTIQEYSNTEIPVIVAIPDPQTKRMCVEQLKSKGCSFANLRAFWVLAPLDYPVGEGTILAAQTVKGEAVIGEFVILFNAMVGTAIIGSYSTILSYANVTSSQIESGAFVGDNALVLEKIAVGSNARIMPGSTVVKRVRENAVVAGVPAVQIKNEKDSCRRKT